MDSHIQQLYQDHSLKNYSAPPIAIVRGEGVRAWDDLGQEYLDFSTGVAVNALGHCHPAWVKAIQHQVATLGHCSNLYANPLQLELAKELTKLAGSGKVFFCNSGAEANEALIKLSRLHGHAHSGREGERLKVVTAYNSFHGRTFGGLSATGQEKTKAGFHPLLPGFVHAEFNNLDSFREVVDSSTAAVFVEPVQGEGGIWPATTEFLQGLRELCDQTGALLLLDEVQSGAGRTGNYFAYEPSGVQADGIAMAKGLGGGFPIGAIWVRDAYSGLFQPGSHGCTFGGNPLACAAALATLRVFEEEDILQNVRQQGSWLLHQLQEMATKHPDVVAGARGSGLLTGLVLKCAVGPVVSACREAGLLTVPAAGDVLRLLPPLNVTRQELSEGLKILEKALSSLAA